MKLLPAVIVCVALLIACSPPPGPTPPEPPLPDAAPDATPCEAACARLDALDCPESQPTPEGGSCVAVCENVESSGYVTMNPTCIAEAESCGAASACEGGAK